MAEEKRPLDYSPTDTQKERIQFVMDEYGDMMNKRTLTYPQFNDRTVLEFTDDNDMRMNAYVLSREEQGKEVWQSNFATRVYANKTKALLAATAKNIPDMKFVAVTPDNEFDPLASDFARDLVRHSYQRGNPVVDLFFLGWSLVGHGTVISYEGFQQHTFTKKKIKSFDLITGDVEFDEVEGKTSNEPVSFEIPLANLLIKNFYIEDIQEQPALIWWSYYSSREQLEQEWGGYPNFKYVKDASTIVPEENETFFANSWKAQAQDDKGYVLMRYLNTFKDIYRVVCNGVELYNGPMLWVSLEPEKKGKKVYPLAKTIFEPFAQGKQFFYGNALPNSAMGEGDTLNTLYNTSLDKTYRSMVSPLLIGMVNKDMLDLEDEVVAGDTKIYVDDINQVKQMEIKGVSDSDVKMIELISRGIDTTTLDPSQEGVAARYVTARAAVAADERARQLKGIFYMFLEHLWWQKARLRLGNIFMTYTKPDYQEVVGEDGATKVIERYRTFNVEGAKLSDGSSGTLAIQFAGSLEEFQGLKPQIETEEAKHQAVGEKYEKVGLMYDFFEKFGYDCQIIPASLWQTSQALAMSMVLEKVTTLAKLFPQFFMANQDQLVRDVLDQYDDTPERYKFPQPMPVMPEGATGGGSAGGGVVSDITGTDQNNSLAKLTGVEQ